MLSSEQNLNKILKDRVNKKLLEGSTIEELSDGIYLAVSKGSSGELVNKLRAELKGLKEEGGYFRTSGKYGLYDD